MGSVRVGSGTGSVVDGNGSFNVGSGTTVVFVGNGNGNAPPPWDFVGCAADVLAGAGAAAWVSRLRALVVDAGLAGAALRFAAVDVRAGTRLCLRGRRCHRRRHCSARGRWRSGQVPEQAGSGRRARSA